MNIVLTGFMASGKTKISGRLAQLLGYELIDTDSLIEKNAEMTINEIFEKYGEAHFRALEREAIKQAAGADKAVISTGGGVVLDTANMDILRENGVIVNLAPSFETVAARLEKAAATRPLLRQGNLDDIRARFEARKPFYDNCDIKIVVTNEKTPDEHAAEIAKSISLQA